MSSGIPFPNKKFEHSWVKLLQLCSKTWYVSGVNLLPISFKNSINNSSGISVYPNSMVLEGLPR